MKHSKQRATPIAALTPASGWIRRFTFNRRTRVLTIITTAGQKLRYLASETVALGLLLAVSAGKYVNLVVKPHCTFLGAA